MPPCFPIPQRAGINTQLLCHPPLGQAELSAGCDEAFRERGGRRQRVVTKEPDDGRHVANKRGGCVAFPIRNRRSLYADLLRNLLLQEFQVYAAGP